MTTIVEFDGASRGNPGPAGIGYRVLPDGDGVEGHEYIGEATNNEAEYTALIRGLESALEKGYTEVIAEGDSQLVVRQVRGQYNVGADNLIPLYKEARTLVEEFDDFEIRHVKRSKNEGADDLANEALDQR
ncbi:ribonuclease HI [Halomicrobium zhouii]|uniref:Ribonuclease HI n=1 Tax=Halomicrobium zhouii TaxID=767519 RepID=A0A1I6L3F8_9EURY|nr:ribonuclease HI family protein [Halomicrobium zhouii]SFR98001.1 ribonuclease HI [Halomicrobium zhouii]